MVLCFRLHFAKDATVGNTAGATVRQLVSLVFERVVIEDASSNEDLAPTKNENISGACEDLTRPSSLSDVPQTAMKPFAHDAFSLFQVSINLIMVKMRMSLPI